MSLHGTLETFALPDVLALLAATRKTGELRVVGGKIDGRVWFDAGGVVGTDVGRSTAYVDAVFELLRLETGKFSFDAEKPAPTPGEPATIESLLAEAQARLAEWKAIEAVIPSVECSVSLVSDVSDPHVMVTGEQWRALVGVASAPTVTSVIDRIGTGEFDTCRTLKGLVEAGLVTIGEPVAAPVPTPEPAAATPEPTPAVEPEPAMAVPEPEAAAAVEPAAAPEPPAAVEPEPAPEPVPAAAAAPAVPVQLASDGGSSRSKIQALTSTPAASAGALEAETAPAPTPAAAEVPAPAPAPDGEADELVRQVAAMESPSAPAAPSPDAAAAPAPAATPEAPAAEAEAEADVPTPGAPAEGEEPINRGLLLKFLSSVRT